MKAMTAMVAPTPMPAAAPGLRPELFCGAEVLCGVALLVLDDVGDGEVARDEGLLVPGGMREELLAGGKVMP